jgi:hypothetical protein
LNAQLPTQTAMAPQEPAPLAPAPQAQPQAQPELAGPADNQPLYQATSEEDAFIIGPTLRPDEPQNAGTAPRTHIPAQVIRDLPLLQRAASEPNADPQLISLVSFLVRELNR